MTPSTKHTGQLPFAETFILVFHGNHVFFSFFGDLFSFFGDPKKANGLNGLPKPGFGCVLLATIFKLRLGCLAFARCFDWGEMHGL